MQGDSTLVARSVAQTLDLLAQKFGATGAHLWSLVVRQVYVSAVRDTFTFIVVAIACGLMFRWARKCLAGDASEDQTVTVWIVALMLFIASLILMFDTVWALTAALANPEYAALQNVLEMVKGK